MAPEDFKGAFMPEAKDFLWMLATFRGVSDIFEGVVFLAAYRGAEVERLSFREGGGFFGGVTSNSIKGGDACCVVVASRGDEIGAENNAD